MDFEEATNLRKDKYDVMRMSVGGDKQHDMKVFSNKTPARHRLYRSHRYQCLLYVMGG